MTDEQWLREGLADAVPDPPANPDRAESAARLAGRRRRTTAAGALAAVGVIAGAAALTAALAGGDGGGSGDQQVADSPPPVSCPPMKVADDGIAEAAVDLPDPDAPDAVPEGATSARLCGGPGLVTGRTGLDQPVTDVTALTDAVNALEQTGPPDVCTMDLGPGYRIAFGYDDGSRFVVSLKLYGCQQVVVGSGYRGDARKLWDEVTGIAGLSPDE